MTLTARTAIILTLLAAAASGAQAQTYGAAYGQQPPLYPYAVQQPYAVEVAPNTYVIQRPAARSNPSITCINCSRNSGYVPAPESAAPKSDRPHKPADRGLIEELRKNSPAKDVQETVINTKKVVREKPVVRETVRVVNDPPRVIERRHIVEDLPPLPPRRHAEASADVVGDTGKTVHGDGKPPRVIRAEAEITILGPDRMTIRLFRKGGEPQAKAQPDE